jgi:hypothetical protein
VNWRQLHGKELVIDAKAMAAGTPLAPCFGSAQDGGVDPPDPRAGAGFAVASRLLALAEGSRQIQLSLAFTAESGSLNGLLTSLRPKPGTTLQSAAIAGEPPLAPDQPGWGLNQALLVELSTAAGWWTLPIQAASLKDSPANAKPAQWELALTLGLLPSDPPLAPLAPGELPRLRLRLRPWREEGSGGGQWRSWGGFEGLRVARARLRVEVGGEIQGKAQGLRELRLQQDRTPVDPAEPFTPFGSEPVLGSSLFLSHPELLDGDLEEISFRGTWQKLPDDLSERFRCKAPLDHQLPKGNLRRLWVRRNDVIEEPVTSDANGSLASQVLETDERPRNADLVLVEEVHLAVAVDDEEHRIAGQPQRRRGRGRRCRFWRRRC